MLSTKKITAAIMTVILMIVVFSILGNTLRSVADSSDAVTDANNCSKGSDVAGPLVYNITDKYCYNSTSDPVYLAEQYDLPLNGLFGKTGVVFVCLMAGFVLLMLAIVKFFYTKKK